MNTKRTQQEDIRRRAKRVGLALEETDSGWLLRDANGKTMGLESLADAETWCPTANVKSYSDVVVYPTQNRPGLRLKWNKLRPPREVKANGMFTLSTC